MSKLNSTRFLETDNRVEFLADVLVGPWDSTGSPRTDIDLTSDYYAFKVSVYNSVGTVIREILV